MSKGSPGIGRPPSGRGFSSSLKKLLKLTGSAGKGMLNYEDERS